MSRRKTRNSLRLEGGGTLTPREPPLPPEALPPVRWVSNPACFDGFEAVGALRPWLGRALEAPNEMGCDGVLGGGLRCPLQVRLELPAPQDRHELA